MFTWMPVIFTFMLASFPAGLVIYWAWNNTLSVSQQYFIMKRQGVKVELWDNLRGPVQAPPKPAGPAGQARREGRQAGLMTRARTPDASRARPRSTPTLLEAGRKLFAGECEFFWAAAPDRQACRR